MGDVEVPTILLTWTHLQAVSHADDTYDSSARSIHLKVACIGDYQLKKEDGFSIFENRLFLMDISRTVCPTKLVHPSNLQNFKRDLS